ncbi:MAG: leucyl aminopeptidase [Clostridium sp.]|uniref:leucyl aminopeptidase n=1 Tax=Clostridium sp. TaxID=1506 RepID=UPI002907113C|nr:leucyl aminopeptidase [Clostridium sp.]
MEFKLNDNGCSSAECVIVPVFENQELCVSCEGIKKMINSVRNSEAFKAVKGDIYHFTNISEETIKHILLVGLGKNEEITSEDVRKIFSKVVKKASELKIASASVKFFTTDGLCKKGTIKAIAEGMALADYSFDKYKTNKSESTLKKVSIVDINDEDKEILESALKEGLSLIKSTVFARDLVNEPANTIYPETLAERCIDAGKAYGFEIEVLDENQIRELGMEAFLAVGMSAFNKPRFIIMRYFGNKEDKENILGLVGKGLTYDAGGYSLKPTQGMVDMKSDMGGAAAVIGAMCSIAEMKLKKNVVAVVAACENLISNDAYKPGDIISSMAGKTIEVVNTDAEGRLTLADAVYYITSRENVNKVIDVATLTGAVLGALGTLTTGVITNDEAFYNDLLSAGKRSGEKFWQLPAFEEYKELLKSKVADYKNSGGRFAGTITAGLFIGEFLYKPMPWLHLDIAGTSFVDGAKDYLTAGGTAAPLRTLYYLVREN